MKRWKIYLILASACIAWMAMNSVLMVIRIFDFTEAIINNVILLCLMFCNLYFYNKSAKKNI